MATCDGGNGDRVVLTTCGTLSQRRSITPITVLYAYSDVLAVPRPPPPGSQPIGCDAPAGTELECRVLRAVALRACLHFVVGAVVSQRGVRAQAAVPWCSRRGA